MSHRRLITPVVAALLLLAPSLGAQQQVTGRVVNSQTGASVSAVQVFIAGSGIGALSQQNGRYLLLNVPVGTHTLTAQRIGYGQQSAEVTVAAGATVVRDFALAEEALGLDEIIVTGTAGGARNREVGTAVSLLQSSELEILQATPSLSVALQGQVPGLIMSQSGPQGGTAPNIALRGRNSVSQGDGPLIYVDGIRIYGKRAGTRGNASMDFNPIAHIKSEDIERIEVVRGPAATTLYGTEAASGVIQIFTKRGSADLPTRWSANVAVGATTLLRAGPPDHGIVEHARDAAGFPFGAYDKDNKKNNNPTGLGYGNCVDRVTSTHIVFRDITCPVDGDWKKPALLQRVNVSVLGGSGGFTFAISGRLADEGAPFDGSGIGQGPSAQFAPMDGRVGYTRAGGVRANFTMDFSPTLHAEWTSSLSLDNIRWVPIGGGSFSVFSAPMQRGFRGAVQVGGEPAAGIHFSQADHVDQRRQVMTGFTLSHLPSSNFDHRLTIGYDLNNLTGENWFHVGHVMRPDGYYRRINWEARTSTFDYGANLRTSLMGGDISSTSSAGFQAYRESTNKLDVQIRDFPGPLAKPTFMSGADRRFQSDQSLEVVNAGGYFQQMFGWKDYFFLTAGLRVDGNSAFGSGFGLQAYPKLSASYVLSDMDFWPSDWFESLRLRGAVGEAGKAPGAFDAVRSWSSIVSGDDEPGFTPGALGDPDLGPERSREYEFGFDASLWGGRVTAEVTAYRQRTYDALIPAQNPPSEGFLAPQLSNIGTLQNQGAEFSLGLGLIRSSILSWDLNLMVGLLESEALDTGGQEIPYGFSRFSGSRGWVREGFPVPAVFGTKVLNADEIADPILEGDAFFGPSYPTHTFGVRSSVTILNNFTIAAFGEYQGGAYLQCQTCQRMTLNQTFEPCYPTLHAQEKADAGDPSDYLTYPADLRAKCSAHPEDQRPDRWYEKNDFFRLRSVNLGYRLPDGLVPGTQSATLSATASNLLTITDYWGNDPEARSSSNFPSVDYHAMPGYRTFTAALSVQF